MEVTEQDLKKLYTWIDDIPLSRPKRNFSRDFSDGVLMAEVLHYYFPKLVQMHNYTSANGLRQKKYNWETLNRKVLNRLGVEVTDEEVEDIVNCKPRAIEALLKLTKMQVLKHQAMKHEGNARVATPDCSDFVFFEEGEDANNRLVIGGRGDSQMRTIRLSQIPRAPTPQSMTPPPTMNPNRRPKSSLDVSSSVEKDLMIKELQETNELLLAKISKLEELIRLKDKKIDSLSARLQSPNNLSRSLTPS